jgi:hypothetical protein
MNRKRAGVLVLGLGLVWLATGWGAAGEPLTAEQFVQVKTAVKPCQGEDRWADVPWLTSLWEARKQAAAQGKPILLWEMDGHPLGCT